MPESFDFDRDGSFSIQLGADRDDAVQQVVVLNESLYVFSIKKIFQIRTAEDIDPDRTAPDTLHSYQEIYPIGCSNSFVARSIIQAKQILDRVILAPGLNKSNVLDVIWEAAELLLRCENAYFQIYHETTSLLARCNELIEEAKSKPSIPSLPQVAELEERVGSFLGSAKRCLEKTHALLGTFYDCPDHGPNFQSYCEWMAANRSSSEAILTLLDGNRTWIRFIAGARNALPVNHARQHFILEVQNFKLQPGNKFSGPSWRHDLSHDRSYRGGPVQEYWSDIIKDMDIHMYNMLTFLEDLYIHCILDRTDKTLPFEFWVHRKADEHIKAECPTLYVAGATRRGS